FESVPVFHHSLSSRGRLKCSTPSESVSFPTCLSLLSMRQFRLLATERHSMSAAPSAVLAAISLARLLLDDVSSTLAKLEGMESRMPSFTALLVSERTEGQRRILDFGKSLCSNLVFPVLTNVESMSVSMTTSIHLIFFIISSALLISRLVTGRTLL